MPKERTLKEWRKRWYNNPKGTVNEVCDILDESEIEFHKTDVYGKIIYDMHEELFKQLFDALDKGDKETVISIVKPNHNP